MPTQSILWELQHYVRDQHVICHRCVTVSLIYFVYAGKRGTAVLEHQEIKLGRTLRHSGLSAEMISPLPVACVSPPVFSPSQSSQKPQDPHPVNNEALSLAFFRPPRRDLHKQRQKLSKGTHTQIFTYLNTHSLPPAKGTLISHKCL